jgi:hypothetical protein
MARTSVDYPNEEITKKLLGAKRGGLTFDWSNGVSPKNTEATACHRDGQIYLPLFALGQRR